ncbi:protein gop [Enterobacter roggenkampii]|uniref:protein gop n=1 Tax=Enterobacter roggenkampii TaxID=1812935 RepID=UPI002005B3E2|nr:protein gop [Enterobacter roggenkampii]MCK6983570.1 protein gop [Enterobacter roggenkampii]
MLNHVYGLIGVVGTIITIATSFIRNQDISQWLLVCSGWLAALLIGWFTHRTIKAISNNHTEVIKSNMDAIKSHNESNQNLMAENQGLIKELARTSEQKEKMEGIAAYLATQNPQINAMPRTASRQESTDSEAN